MSSTKELTTSFCQILKDFLNDIYMSYPDPKLLIFQQATNAMVMSNPLGVVENFMKSVSKYSDKILAKDEAFFIEGGLEEHIQGEYSFLTEELKKITNIWKDPKTPLKTKNSIWKYLQILVKLGQKIVA